MSQSQQPNDPATLAFALTVLRALLLVSGAVFLALVVEAIRSESFADSFAAITALRWGVVSLVDLYLGFAVFSVLLGVVERSWKRGLICFVLSCVLGNIVPIVWVSLRLRRWMKQAPESPM
jgi:hypothetical protein